MNAFPLCGCEWINTVDSYHIFNILVPRDSEHWVGMVGGHVDNPPPQTRFWCLRVCGYNLTMFFDGYVHLARGEYWIVQVILLSMVVVLVLVALWWSEVGGLVKPTRFYTIFRHLLCKALSVKNNRCVQMVYFTVDGFWAKASEFRLSGHPYERMPQVCLWYAEMHSSF